MNQKVLIIYKFLPQWRVDFFNKLRIALADKQIELNLIYGKLKNKDAFKENEVDLPWAKYVRNKIAKFDRLELYWQPCLNEIKKHDLIIVEQANKLLLNYVLILVRKLSKKKFAFWGHGLNRQDNPHSISNKFKKLYLKQCDWWFAYTEGVKKFIVNEGFDPERITSVQNAIDTNYLVKEYWKVSNSSLDKFRLKLRLGLGPIGIYCGGMYKEKRLNFIIDACDLIKEKLPDFSMLFIGAGSESDKIRKAAQEKRWIHFIGSKFGKERIPYFKLSDVLLMPGLVGLVILDSFALQTPIITTNYPFHSPEIEYLRNGINGMIVEGGIKHYASAVVNLLKQRDRLDKLKEGCRKSAGEYTLERMVENFTSGIIQILQNT